MLSLHCVLNKRLLLVASMLSISVLFSCVKQGEINVQSALSDTFKIENPALTEKKILTSPVWVVTSVFDGTTEKIYTLTGKESYRLVSLQSNTEFQKLNDIPFHYEHSGTHMYSQFAYDKRIGTLLVDSEGVIDLEGRYLWHYDSPQGFGGVVPIKLNSEELMFLVEGENAEYRDIFGNILRTFGDTGVVHKKNLLGVSIIKTGNECLYVLKTQQAANYPEIEIYNQKFNLIKNIKFEGLTDFLPADWQNDGSLLLTVGNNRGIETVLIDTKGKEQFRFKLSNLSFSIAHLVATETLNIKNRGYLSVVYSASSSSNRSVMVIFDQNGELIWQKEYQRIFSLTKSLNNESFIFGGLDGLTEIKITPPFSP